MLSLLLLSVTGNLLFCVTNLMLQVQKVQHPFLYIVNLVLLHVHWYIKTLRNKIRQGVLTSCLVHAMTEVVCLLCINAIMCSCEST